MDGRTSSFWRLRPQTKRARCRWTPRKNRPRNDVDGGDTPTAMQYRGDDDLVRQDWKELGGKWDSQAAAVHRLHDGVKARLGAA